ncbi:MAG: cysteine desulfurase [Firmicutes bacterium]|nr:cysteine desulfurase [Bacillota bacterium]
MIYLDNSATTKPSAAVIEAMTKALQEDYGNPSSLYKLGLSAEKLLKASRASVAKSLGASPEEIFFTSCGTESDNTAIKAVWESRNKQGKRVITTQVEHPAVLNCCKWLQTKGADVVFLPVDRRGLISLEALEQALTDDTILVSIMHVNNESGAIMPIAEISALLKKEGSKAVFHSDGVQSWGKLPLDMKALGVDLYSVSGHKVHGPKGVGALYVKKGLHLPAFMHGGGQELNFRSGTENMPGIAGIGAAADAIISALPEKAKAMEAAKLHLKERLMADIDNICFNGPDADGPGACRDAAPSVMNVSFIGCRGEVLLHTLDTAGICVSTGSACSSKVKGSHVLSAMGLKPEEIEGAVRFSFSDENTPEEMDYVADTLKTAVESQRRLRAAFKKR